MKIFSSSHDFDYTFNEVSIANWNKYCPWNDKSTHVVAVDTLDRSLDLKTKILRTERLITCRQSAPQWLRTFTGSADMSHVYEVSYVDLSAKKVTMCSQNMTWNDLISVQETVVYRPSPDAADSKTRFEQTARIVALCGGWQRIKSGIEEFTVQRFRENSIKGREGFEAVLEMSRKVFQEQREQQRTQHGFP